MTLRGQKEEVLNLASSDFLGLSKLESFKEKAKNALDKYGCGACGPRGFYGTIDVHLEFEKMLAEFMGTEEAICYSDGASAVSSCIPAYSKRGDLLVVDEGVGEPIRTGVNLSRSTVHYFKHNDMEDLNRVLKKIVDNDKKYKRNALQQRRFIVVEGLYRLSGDLCPLPDIIKLKDQFCFRLMLDESLSFGTVGNTGRGVTEHFGVAMKNIDMCLVSMDTTLGSIGGGCVGTNEVVDHQRLSGSGYCFSASCPPFLFAAAVDALEHLKSDGPDLLIKMRGNVKALTAGVATIPHVKVISDPESPVFHVALDTQKGLTYDEELVIAKNIADKCVKNGVGLIAVSHDFKLLKDIKTTSKSFRATLRVNVTANLTSNEINKIVKELKGAVKEFV